jgi:hypothetical protein
MAVPPVFSGLRHPERSQRERTRREDRHFKFYEIPDNLECDGVIASVECQRSATRPTPARSVASAMRHLLPLVP